MELLWRCSEELWSVSCAVLTVQNCVIWHICSQLGAPQYVWTHFGGAVKNRLPRIIEIYSQTLVLTYILAFCHQVFICLTTKFDRRISPLHLYLTRHFSAAECIYKSTATCSVNVCVYVCVCVWWCCKDEVFCHVLIASQLQNHQRCAMCYRSAASHS